MVLVQLGRNKALALTSYVFITSQLLSGCASAAEQANSRVNSKQSAWQQHKDQTMQITVADFVFSIPDSWRDTSSYTYKSKDQSYALTVSFGKTRGQTSLEDLVQERQQNVQDTMGEEVEFMSQKAGEMATLPAIYQQLRFSDPGQQYQEFWATAFYGQNKYLLLSYVGPSEDHSLQATFEHIVTTSQPIAWPQSPLLSDEYVWRQAQILRLQVPTQLKPPRHYTFVSSDGSVNLKVSVYQPGDSWPDSSLREQAENDLRFGGKVGKVSEQVKSNLGIQEIDYVFKGGDPIEPSLIRAHRAQIAGFSGRVFVYLKGSESQAEKIDVFWRQFIDTLVANTLANAELKTQQQEQGVP